MKNTLNLGLVAGILFSICGCTTTASYVANGNKLFEAGKYREASISYRKAIQEDPRYGEAHYRLGLTAIKLSDGALAYSALLQAVQLLPANVDAKEKLGELCLGMYLADRRRPENLYNLVTKLSRELLARDPKSFEGLRLKGFLLASDRKPQEAIAVFQEALQVKPLEPIVTTALVQTFLQNGQSEDGEKLAFNLIPQHRTYSPIYDELYRWYLRSNRVAEAENILSLKVRNNPKEASYILELAAHYEREHNSSKVGATLEQLVNNSEAFPRGRIQVGDFYLRTGNYAEAMRYYQQAPLIDPRQTIISKERIANVLVLQTKQDEAQKVIEEILREQPQNEEALHLRAKLGIERPQTENLDHALADLKALSSRKPEDASIWFDLGRAYRLKGNLEAARIQFLEALQRRPDYVQARHQLAQVALAMHRPKETLQQATEILRLQPDDAEGKLLHAVGLMDGGDREQARAELTQLIKQFPASALPKILLGELELSDKQYDAAADIFTKISGDDPRAVVGMAVTYASERQFGKAIEILNDALQKSPESTMLRAQLAKTAALDGQYDRAVAEFRKLLVRDSKSVQLRLHLAEVYEMKGDYSSAIPVYRSAQAISPEDPRPTLALAAALTSLGRPAEAKAQYQNVLKLQPDNSAAMNNLAFLLSEVGDLDEALRLAQRAVAKAPQEPQFLDTLAYIYLKKGMRDSAVRTFADLVRKYPRFALFHYHYGLALLENGDKTGARRELKAALAEHPSAQEELRIRELVRKTG